MKIKINKLKIMTDRILSGLNVPQKDKDLIFECFLDAEIRGKCTHGFLRFPGTVKLLRKFSGVVPLPQIIKKSVNMLHIDGNGTAGLIAAKTACDELLKIHSQPIVIASVSNYFATTGALGYYARFLAEHNKISIIFTNTKSAVAPYGGIKPVMGTNPLAVGIPNGDNPIISDLSTSAIAYSDILIARQEGLKLPDDVLIDSEGKPTNDPNDLTSGCLLPLAGHKGYALGLAAEILAGVFIGAKSGNEVPGSEGMLIIAIDSNAFISKEQYDRNLDSFISEIVNSQTAEGFARVRLPGDNASVPETDEFVEIKDYAYKDIEQLYSETEQGNLKGNG